MYEGGYRYLGGYETPGFTVWFKRKLRIRKQSTSPVKPTILLKLLGTITIDYCNIVVHISTAYLVPDMSLQDTEKQ